MKVSRTVLLSSAVVATCCASIFFLSRSSADFLASCSATTQFLLCTCSGYTIDNCLQGVAVRDCSCVLADQACVMLPADMGAEVIKIETQVGNWAQSVRAIERQSGTFLLHAL
ncbi:hypothetical protein D7S70_06435 [Ralstonia pickettii]|uniref:CoA transferase n=1 Tax=unclassified Ralstonia TaxID=209769 RepID=UPI0010F44AD8|nr:hypothetical protein [Ralstonia pickettii]NPT50374.1 hypothetical protein [Ralstonia sp. 3N]MBB0033351.1 hypothetical protein [Ralstonia pickettii]MBB0096120.1 hypothetical protein [Ralstonia pickettii]MBB0105819.1 hypothetical protein [Ralstonia pickettii]